MIVLQFVGVSQTLLLFNLQYLGHYLNYSIQTWHDGRLMDVLYAHARFNDLDLDARSQWIGNGKLNQRCMLSATKQAISIKLATAVGHFIRDLDLDFATFYMACPTCLFCFVFQRDQVWGDLNINCILIMVI